VVDPQKQAKMLAQFWCRFHNDGIGLIFQDIQTVVCFDACQEMFR